MRISWNVLLLRIRKFCSAAGEKICSVNFDREITFLTLDRKDLKLTKKKKRGEGKWIKSGTSEQRQQTMVNGTNQDEDNCLYRVCPKTCQVQNYDMLGKLPPLSANQDGVIIWSRLTWDYVRLWYIHNTHDGEVFYRPIQSVLDFKDVVLLGYRDTINISVQCGPLLYGIWI